MLTNIQDQLIVAGIRSGVDSAINGADFSDTLKNNLRFAGAAVLGAQLSQQIGIEFSKNQFDPETGINRGTQLLAHVALGCAVGAVGTGNCSAGAAGQLAGEISALAYAEISPYDIELQVEEWRARGVDVARLSGAIASALAGGDANDVNLGANAGGVAAENNALFLIPILVGVLSFAGGYVSVTGYADLIEKGGEAYNQPNPNFLNWTDFRGLGHFMSYRFYFYNSFFMLY